MIFINHSDINKDYALYLLVKGKLTEELTKGRKYRRTKLLLDHGANSLIVFGETSAYSISQTLEDEKIEKLLSQNLFEVKT